MKETLLVALTAAEITEYGRRLASFEKSIAELELAKKAAAENFKTRINKLRGEIDFFAERINTESEYRSVEVRKIPNYRKKQWEFVRLDTGEVFRSCQMSADDLQGRLFDSPSEPDDDAADEGPVEDVPTDGAFQALDEVAEAAGGDLDVSVSFSGERGAPGLESAMEQ